MKSAHPRHERGAAAVEFALVLVPLMLLVVGIAEFGHAYQVQTLLSQAAREGARHMALGASQADAEARTAAFAEPHTIAIDVDGPENCDGSTDRVTFTVTTELDTLTGLFDFATITISGKGVMRCNG